MVTKPLLYSFYSRLTENRIVIRLLQQPSKTIAIQHILFFLLFRQHEKKERKFCRNWKSLSFSNISMFLLLALRTATKSYTYATVYQFSLNSRGWERGDFFLLLAPFKSCKIAAVCGCHNMTWVLYAILLFLQHYYAARPSDSPIDDIAFLCLFHYYQRLYSTHIFCEHGTCYCRSAVPWATLLYWRAILLLALDSVVGQYA